MKETTALRIATALERIAIAAERMVHRGDPGTAPMSSIRAQLRASVKPVSSADAVTQLGITTETLSKYASKVGRDPRRLTVGAVERIRKELDRTKTEKAARLRMNAKKSARSKKSS